MNVRKLIYLVFGTIVFACSGREEVAMPLSDLRMENKSVIFFSEELVKYTVIAFREEQGSYSFLQQFKNGWSDDGKLEVQLPVGNYKFLFASSYDMNTILQPEFQLAQTTFDEMKFSVKEDNATNGLLRAGDELFLQDQGADSIYEITTSSTIRCTLKRAVAQVRLFVKRGRKVGENLYEPLPYSVDESIIRYFNKIGIDIHGVGEAVDARCISKGKGYISEEIPMTDCDSVTREGFVTFTGPFFFPSVDDKSVDFIITLYASENAPQPKTLTLKTSHVLARNQQLIITAWIVDDWNFIGVTTDIQPIRNEIDGEQDIWGDNVQHFYNIGK